MPRDGIREFLASKFGLAVTLSAAALGVYLLLTHTGHAFAALPYLILLLCPLLHFFGHGHGHGHGHEHGDRKEHRHD